MALRIPAAQDCYARAGEALPQHFNYLAKLCCGIADSEAAEQLGEISAKSAWCHAVNSECDDSTGLFENCNTSDNVDWARYISVEAYDPV